MVVDTKNWWSDRKVLISPRWVRNVGWSKRTVDIDVDCEAVKRMVPLRCLDDG